MTGESDNKTVESVGFGSRVRVWVRNYPFALVAAACAILILGCRIAHLPWNSPLAAISGGAWLVMMLFGIVSIFCDRTSWPGLLLFWASIFLPFI